jgi:hypothetical protein
VLDEADRILDLGFEKAVNAIVANLPPRQTLLFSATLTPSVRTLARLSLSVSSGGGGRRGSSLGMDFYPPLGARSGGRARRGG